MDALLHNSLLLSFFILCPHADALTVMVPARHLVAARGHSVVLGCEFSPFVPNTDMSSLLVTWQRQEDNRVVHSFYYEKDQLDRQDSAYLKRTSLFLNELSKGNASLRIDNVGVKDAGRYLCAVSTSKGTDKKELQLEYGAFYTEPRLTINVRSSDILLQYETEGFPEPKMAWKGERGEDLGDLINTSVGSDEVTGLYYIKSNYTAPNSKLNITFLLENQLLDQHLQRTVSYTGEQNSCFNAHIALAVMSSLFLLSAVILVCTFKCKKMKMNKK